MTLFIRRPTRQYEISDLYIMILSFWIFFALGKIVRSVIEKRKRQESKHIQIPNPKGGGIELQASNDEELSKIILSCIADNEIYLVKDERIVKLIFNLVKIKIQHESLILTPNMIRFLALKLLNNDLNLFVKMGNTILLSDNPTRLLTRSAGTAIFGLLGGLIKANAGWILLTIVFFDLTKNCGYGCDNYFERISKTQFEHISKTQPVKVFTEKPTGQLIIAGNDDARQIELYIPSKTSDQVTITSNGEAKITRVYKKSPRKAKLQTFSDFKANDKVLSSFDNVEEPYVPQKTCEMDDVHDVLKLRID